MARFPTGPFSLHATGCYGCVRWTPADGGCGISSYPCVHWGMDLFSSTRDVWAPEGGEVVAVADGSSAPWSGYGPGIIAIKGDSGKYLMMAHLGSIEVTKGQRVREGQHIGMYSPSYGHTHFEVRHNLTGPSSTNTMDPYAWIAGERAMLALKLGGAAALAYWAAHWATRGVGQ